MRKSELIDAAEASGLSRAPVMPEKGKGKPRQFGSSPREWYSGWSCMKTLVTKGLVVKSSCPAKYMLTEEGKKAARECLSRSGLATSSDTVERSLDFDERNPTDQEFPHTDIVQESSLNHVSIAHKKSAEVPPESLNKFLSMGYSKEQILLAFSDVQKSSPNKNMSFLWPAVLCRLREAEVYGSSSDFQNKPRCDPRPLPTNSYIREGETNTYVNKNRTGSGGEGEPCISKSKIQPNSTFHTDSSQIDLSMKACSTTDNQVLKQHRDGRQFESNVLTVPPLSFGETFKDAYDVILILDDREKFTIQGSKSRKIVENISKEFNIEIELSGKELMTYEAQSGITAIEIKKCAFWKTSVSYKEPEDRKNRLRAWRNRMRIWPCKKCSSWSSGCVCCLPFLDIYLEFFMQFMPLLSDIPAMPPSLLQVEHGLPSNFIWLNFLLKKADGKNSIFLGGWPFNFFLFRCPWDISSLFLCIMTSV